MRCPKCQAENSDDAEYCSLCYARFQVQLRSSDVDETARRMHEKHQDSKLCCPSCMSLNPLNSPFCLNCAFVFEDLETLMVSGEEIERMEREAQSLKEQEMRSREIEAITVTPESDGAAVMRNLADQLARGLRPRIHAHGRNAVTYTMKIIALLGEDMRAGGSELRSKVYLISEGSITHLDDVKLEIILEGA